MFITLEISYYPLSEEFQKPINDFITKLSINKEIKIETGTMSSLISGNYSEVMGTLTESMKSIMEKYPSVFNIKISNTCPLK